MNKQFNRLEQLKKNSKLLNKLQRKSLLFDIDLVNSSNYFFKNKITQYTYKCRCTRCTNNKIISSLRLIESFEDSISDYNYEDDYHDYQ